MKDESTRPGKVRGWRKDERGWPGGWTLLNKDMAVTLSSLECGRWDTDAVVAYGAGKLGWAGLHREPGSPSLMGVPEEAPAVSHLYHLHNR